MPHTGKYFAFFIRCHTGRWARCENAESDGPQTPKFKCWLNSLLLSPCCVASPKGRTIDYSSHSPVWAPRSRKVMFLLIEPGKHLMVQVNAGKSHNSLLCKSEKHGFAIALTWTLWDVTTVLQHDISSLENSFLNQNFIQGARLHVKVLGKPFIEAKAQQNFQWWARWQVEYYFLFNTGIEYYIKQESEC